jgi:hypothetical protein
MAKIQSSATLLYPSQQKYVPSQQKCDHSAVFELIFIKGLKIDFQYFMRVSDFCAVVRDLEGFSVREWSCF